MHLQGCLSLNQVDLLFSANHVPDKMEPAQRHALCFSGLQDPRIAIYAWPADGIRTPDVRLIFCRTQAAQLRKGAGKMAGTTGLAPARISAVTGRHLGYFGLVPIKLRHFHKAGTPGRNSTCISDVRSVALCILSYEGIQNGAGGWCCPSCLFSVNEALSC